MIKAAYYAAERVINYMLKEYLQSLKAKRGYSWSEIANLSNIPEPTVRKIITGETETPRIDTVIALVNALGGELNGIIEDKNIKKNIIPLIESYEQRLKDKDEQIRVLRKEKRTIALLLIIISAIIFSLFIADVLIGTRGWILYK